MVFHFNFQQRFIKRLTGAKNVAGELSKILEHSCQRIPYFESSFLKYIWHDLIGILSRKVKLPL